MDACNFCISACNVKAILRPPRGVREAHLGHACKPCYTAAMEEMSLPNPPLDTWRTITTYFDMFVMGLLQ